MHSLSPFIVLISSTSAAMGLMHLSLKIPHCFFTKFINRMGGGQGHQRRHYIYGFIEMEEGQTNL